jgi:hypothetical protein
MWPQAPLDSLEKPLLRHRKGHDCTIIRRLPFQELDMPQRGKSADADQQKRPAGAIDDQGREQKGAPRPEGQQRAWTSLNKLDAGGKKAGAGRKVPFGPVGGLGRKTNLSRSS